MITTIPRRGSVNIEDPRFDARVAGDRPVSVWLDGIEQRDVVTYDMDEGFIVRLIRDDQNNLRLNADRSDVMSETVHGEVRAAWTAATVS